MSLSQYLLIGAVALCGLALGAVYFGQRRLIYYPDRVRTAPVEAGLAGVEERILKTPDGARVVAWYGKAQPGQPTILYFHGNAGSLANRAPRIERFMGEGWGVYMMTYRGYGGGTGKPTEAHNVADARLAYGALVCTRAWSRRRSSSMASRWARALPCGWRRSGRWRAWCSMRPTRRSSMSLPASIPSCRCGCCSPTATSSTKYIKQVRAPLLILHGERDEVIPVAMGRELFRQANEPKRLAVFPNGGHSDLYLDGNGALEAMRAWITELRRTTAP